ncbi:MAG: hypothetical protein EPN22_11185 [Nitrospirae bacterium]|nr:MAG: hypothetical protein EPN22_11185 [Nitrospirota bacterium]
MKIITAILAVVITVVFVGSAMAVPPGKTTEFAGGAMGKVTFDGKTHADKGLKCNDCHTKVFQMKKEAKPKMADHKTDKFCFGCHNGTKAFKTDGNCAKCHKK